MNYKDWIIRDPKICDGQPVIKGTQITLKAVLGHLALGDTIENIVKTYPGMTPEGVRAVIAFAASFADLELAGTISPQLPTPNLQAPSLGALSKKELETLTSTLGRGFMSIAVADIYTRQGLHLEAAKVYRNILKLEPDNEEVKKRLKDVEEKMNRDS